MGADPGITVNKRVKGGVTQYKVKWKGWNNRYNCWRDQSDLECQELIDKYEEAYLGMSQPEVMQCVLALVLNQATAGAVADDRVQESVDVHTEGLHCQLQGLDSLEAVRRLHGCRLLVQVITRTSPKRRVITSASNYLSNYFKITSEVLSGN